MVPLSRAGVALAALAGPDGVSLVSTGSPRHVLLASLSLSDSVAQK